MKKLATALACIFLSSGAALAQNITPQVLRAYCETPPHWTGGAGQNCRSEWQEIRAPKGYVFAKDGISGGLTSTQGGEHGECILEWGEWSDVVPGIKQPAFVRMQAYGEMNHGDGEGGHSRCEYTVPLVKIQK